jgi:ligand-binding sensor domain-containing protein
MKYCIAVVLTSIILSLHAQPHQNWLNYTHSQQVRDIDIHGDDIWVSTQGGLIKYNKETGSKKFYNRANSNLPGNNLLSVLCSSNNSIWITDRHYGIGKFKNSECTIYNESNSSLPFNQWNMKILEDSENNIWISSFRWMAKYDGKNWKTWITGSDLSAFPVITSFDINDNDVVWMFSSEGIGKIENEEYTVVSDIGKDLISQNSFVKVDNNNQVWVAIQNEGIYKYDGIEFVNYNTQNSCLPTDTITAISFDSENNAWLSSDIGLIKFNQTNCELFQPNGNEQALLTLEYVNDNEIWCGSYNGKLLKFNGSTFESIELSNSPLKSNDITDIYAGNDNVWIGTSENIVKGKVNQLKHSSAIKDAYFTEDENGNLWVASNTESPRLLKINGNDTIVYDSQNSPIHPRQTFTDITVNSNGLWIATKYGGH